MSKLLSYILVKGCNSSGMDGLEISLRPSQHTSGFKFLTQAWVKAGLGCVNWSYRNNLYPEISDTKRFFIT